MIMITDLALNLPDRLRRFRKIAAKLSSLLSSLCIDPEKWWGRRAKAGEDLSVSWYYYVRKRSVFNT